MFFRDILNIDPPSTEEFIWDNEYISSNQDHKLAHKDNFYKF